MGFFQCKLIVIGDLVVYVVKLHVLGFLFWCCDVLSSLSVFSRVGAARSSFSMECFVDRCLSLCPFSFGYCVVCSSAIHSF